MDNIKKAWKWIKDNLGPAFVMLEAGMHIYLAIYLTFNWTNLAIWGFTVFEMIMFIYLLVHRKKGQVLHK